MPPTVKNDSINGHVALNGHAHSPNAPVPAGADLGGMVVRNAAAEARGEQALDLNVAGLLRAFRRRYYLILPLAVLGAAVATWLASEYLATPSYTARTFLRVADQPGILANGAIRGDVSAFQKSQLAIVKSRYVLRLACDQLKGRNLDMLQGGDPVPTLEKDLKADFSVAPDIMQITLKGESGEEVTAVLDAIRDAYLTEVINKDRTARTANLDQVKALIARQSDEVDKQRGLLNDKLASMHVRDVAAQRLKLQQAQSELSSLQVELRLAQSARGRLDLEARALEKDAEPAVSQSSIDSAVEEIWKKDATALDLESRAAKAEQYVIAHKAVTDRVTPALQERMDQWESIRKQLAEHKSKLVRETAEKLKDQQRRERSANLSRVRDQADIKKNEERLLIEQTVAADHRIDDLTRQLAELDGIRETIAPKDEILKKARDRQQSLELELNEPSRASTIEESVITIGPNPVKQASKLILPGIAAALLLLIGGAWLEYRTGRVSSLTEVSERLGNMLVVGVPSMPDRVRLGRDGNPRQQQMLSDAIDTARTLLMGAHAETGRQIVALTSAQAGEGKTSLAVQLAGSLARSGRSTLIVDADLRNPTLHRVLGLAAEPGLADLLRGQTELADAVRRERDLSVLTAGRCDPREIVGLFQNQLPQLFDALRERFDCIVVDGPPVLGFPDAILLGKNSDGVVLSSMRDVSRLENLQSACERLNVLSIPVLGTVLNGAPAAADYPPASHA
jgi:polysaccharide biosynthesis transport protein